MKVIHLIVVNLFWVVFGLSLCVVTLLIPGDQPVMALSGLVVESVALSYSLVAIVEIKWPDKEKER
jgi:membrane protein DedA with SNARE-associated domain